MSDPSELDITEPFLAEAWAKLSPRDRIRLLSDSPKTLWLFGAGASHHYDLNSWGVPIPLANGFFEAFNELPTSRTFSAHVGPFVSYLNHYRDVRPDRVHEFKENIEAFMTSVECELLEIKKVKEKKGRLAREEYAKMLSVVTAMNNMTFILANVINEAQNGPSRSLYTYLLEFCGPKDVFVTFNWDTLLDRALAATGGWSPANGYGLSFSATLDSAWLKTAMGSSSFSTNWRLLKLHGSTNWLVPYSSIDFQTLEPTGMVPHSDQIFLYWQSTLSFNTHNSRWRGGYAPTCYGYYPPNIPAEYFERSQLAAKPGYTFVQVNPGGVFSPFKEPSADGVPSSPLLITPVKQKRYEDYATSIERVWQAAEVEFQEVERIVVIGYSFPETDTRPLQMMRDALSMRSGFIDVHIVAPDAEQIASRIGVEYLKHAKSHSLHSGKFEDYIEFLAQSAHELMKRAAAGSGDVEEWLKRLFVMEAIALSDGLPFRDLSTDEAVEEGERLAEKEVDSPEVAGLDDTK
jgi:hypothetical protein